jgi:hypothetical protein
MTPQDQPPAPTLWFCDACGREGPPDTFNEINNRTMAGFVVCKAPCKRQPPPDPPAPTQEPHRCSGCGHRWDGPLKGTELCGDCWRKGQSAIFAPPATTLRALIEQKIEKWRAKARRFNFEADEDRRRRSVGLAESKEWEASRLLDCAAELKALLTETDGPAPQKDQNL